MQRGTGILGILVAGLSHGQVVQPVEDRDLLVQVVQQHEAARDALDSLSVHYSWYRMGTVHTRSTYATNQYRHDTADITYMVQGEDFYMRRAAHMAAPVLGQEHSVVTSIALNADYLAFAWNRDEKYVYQYDHSSIDQMGNDARTFMGLADPNILNYGFSANGERLSDRIVAFPELHTWQVEPYEGEWGAMYRLVQTAQETGALIAEFNISADTGFLITRMAVYNDGSPNPWYEYTLTPMQLADGTWFPQEILLQRTEFEEYFQILAAQANQLIPGSQFELSALDVDRDRAKIVRVREDGSTEGLRFNAQGETMPRDYEREFARMRAERGDEPVVVFDKETGEVLSYEGFEDARRRLAAKSAIAAVTTESGPGLWAGLAFILCGLGLIFVAMRSVRTLGRAHAKKGT